MFAGLERFGFTYRAAAKMRALIYGGGAVGLGLASCLLKSGSRLDIIARENTVGSLRKDGLLRTGIFGEYHAGPSEFGCCASLDELDEQTYKPATTFLYAPNLSIRSKPQKTSANINPYSVRKRKSCCSRTDGAMRRRSHPFSTGKPSTQHVSLRDSSGTDPTRWKLRFTPTRFISAVCSAPACRPFRSDK